MGGISLFRTDTDLVYLNLLGKDVIILNSTKTISDLLDKRSKIYSDKVRTSSFSVLVRPVSHLWGFPAPIPHGRTVSLSIRSRGAT